MSYVKPHYISFTLIIYKYIIGDIVGKVSIVIVIVCPSK